jgi:hypothetical protein
MTVEQLEAFSNTKPELRYITEEIIKYLGANPGGGSPGGSSYLVYTALLIDTVAFQPPGTVTVLENTLIGTPVWSFDTDHWVVTLAGGFSGNVAGFASGGAWVSINKINNDSVRVDVFSETFQRDVSYWVTGNPIEIRVYP